MIAIVALVGNMLTVALFIKKSKWLKKAHGCLICALSIQDILTAICLLSLPSFVLDHDVSIFSICSRRHLSLYLPYVNNWTLVCCGKTVVLQKIRTFNCSCCRSGSHSMGCLILLRSKHSTECQTNWAERDIHMWLEKGWKFDNWKDRCCCIYISWFVLYSCHDNGGGLCWHYFAHETIKSQGRRYYKHCQIQSLKTCNIDCIFCVDHYHRLLAARSIILRFITRRVNSTWHTSTLCPEAPRVCKLVRQSIYL